MSQENIVAGTSADNPRRSILVDTSAGNSRHSSRSRHPSRDRPPLEEREQQVQRPSRSRERGHPRRRSSRSRDRHLQGYEPYGYNPFHGPNPFQDEYNNPFQDEHQEDDMSRPSTPGREPGPGQPSLHKAFNDLSAVVRYLLRPELQEDTKTKRALQLLKPLSKAKTRKILGIDAVRFGIDNDTDDDDETPPLFEMFEREGRPTTSQPNALDRAKRTLQMKYQQPFSDIGSTHTNFYPELIAVSNEYKLAIKDIERLVDYFVKGKANWAYKNQRKFHGPLRAIENLGLMFYESAPEETYDSQIRAWTLNLKKDISPQIQALAMLYAASSTRRSDCKMRHLIKEQVLRQVPLDIKGIMDQKEVRYESLHAQQDMPIDRFIIELTKTMKRPGNKTVAGVSMVTASSNDHNNDHGENVRALAQAMVDGFSTLRGEMSSMKEDITSLRLATTTRPPTTSLGHQELTTLRDELAQVRASILAINFHDGRDRPQSGEGGQWRSERDRPHSADGGQGRSDRPYDQGSYPYGGNPDQTGYQGGYNSYRPRSNSRDPKKDGPIIHAGTDAFYEGIRSNTFNAFDTYGAEDDPAGQPLFTWDNQGKYTPLVPVVPLPEHIPTALVERGGKPRISYGVLRHFERKCPYCSLPAHRRGSNRLCPYAGQSPSWLVCQRCRLGFHLTCLLSETALQRATGGNRPSDPNPNAPIPSGLPPPPSHLNGPPSHLNGPPSPHPNA